MLAPAPPPLVETCISRRTVLATRRHGPVLRPPMANDRVSRRSVLQGVVPPLRADALGCRRTLDDVNAFVRMGQPPTEIVPGLYLGNEGNASDVACQRARRADGTDAVGCDLFVFCLLLVFVASLGASDFAAYLSSHHHLRARCAASPCLVRLASRSWGCRLCSTSAPTWWTQATGMAWLVGLGRRTWKRTRVKSRRHQARARAKCARMQSGR